MQKSLFSRYYSVYVTMIMVCIATLGLVFLAFASQYFRNDKTQLLERTADLAAAITLSDFQQNNEMELSSQILYNGYTLLGAGIEADIFLVDTQGKTLLCTHYDPCVHTTYLVDQSIIDQVQKGSFDEMGRLGGIYKDLYYTVGVPLHRSNGAFFGAVFVSASAEALTVFLWEVLKMFLVSSLAVLLVSFVIIYFVTRRLVTPLEQMVVATQNFSKGDFSTRVPVEGYDEIGKLAMAFNNMASTLATQDVTSRSFIANVSHELKTPMTTIGGFIDGMLDGTIPEEKHPQYLAIVSEEVKRLSRVVRSMLDIAKIEQGEMSINPISVNIHDIVCMTVFTFEKAIEDKGLEIRGLDIEEKFMVDCDPDLIHQVVYNLIDNAVKFVNEGGYIEFSYTTEGPMTYVSVKNSGEGISKEEISRIFDRFYKSDKSRSLDRSGVGLGLHIVRSIVGLHSGEVMVRSAEGQYSEFLFSLPTSNPKQMTTTIFRRPDKPRRPADDE